jgi:N-acetylmuramate 1-kinase
MNEHSKMGERAIHLADETATERLGVDIALALKPGDVVLMQGELGAGKTTLARAIIRQIAGNFDLEVVSPTYMICREYESAPPVRHFDLYRIADADEVDELGLEDGMAESVTLIEWPERLATGWNGSVILIRFANDVSHGRQVTITGPTAPHGALPARVERSLEIRAFLDQSWGVGARRALLIGDASARRYETAELGGEVRVVMDAPARPDGPPAHQGKSYSQIAHLAEDVVPFIAVDEWLREQGFVAPRIHSRRIDAGLLLLDHLGADRIIDSGGRPIRERYLAAARLLARLHRLPPPGNIEIADESGRARVFRLPEYDRQALMAEASLFADWYIPRHKHPLDVAERARYDAIWNALIDRIEEAKPALVLRDFHSPNLLWQEGPPFPGNLGLLDFQDAAIGPCAYDVASLAQDARTTISAGMEAEILDGYIREFSAGGAFDEGRFRQEYAIMAVHRVTKILGIFVRLDERDNKPAYLGLLPGLRAYLARTLASPHLRDYRDWCARVAGITSAK